MPDSGTTLRARLHYKRLGLDKGWPKEKFLRLCDVLELTPFELGAVLNIPKRNINQWLAEGKFPPYIAKDLAIIQSWLIKAKAPKADIEPVIPIHETPIFK